MAKKTESSISKPAAPVKPAAPPTALVTAPTAPAQPPAKAAAKKQPAANPVKAAIKKKTKPAAKKAAKPAASAYTRGDVALRAYFIAEKRHALGLHGSEHGDWLEAERQLAAENGKSRRLKKA